MDVSDIEKKEDSAEKLAAVAGMNPKNILFATEFNMVVDQVIKNSSRVFNTGELLTFKLSTNMKDAPLEPADFVVGVIEDQFIIGQLLPSGVGNPFQIGSYKIILTSATK